MKCYDFELNLTAYIEGNIKEKDRKLFLKHKDECGKCEIKLNDMIHLIKVMPKMKTYETSSSFMRNLNRRIFELDNKEPSLWKKIQTFRPFGYSPAPAIGFALSFVMIMVASYVLFDNDQIPDLNIDDFSNQNKNNNPSIIISPQKSSIMADSDSTERKNVKNRYDDKIKLVRGK